MSMSTLGDEIEAKVANGDPQDVLEPGPSAQHSFGPSPLRLVNNSGSNYQPSATEKAACDEVNDWRILMNTSESGAASPSAHPYWRAQMGKTAQEAERRWLKEHKLFEKRFPGKACHPAGVFLKRDE